VAEVGSAVEAVSVEVVLAEAAEAASDDVRLTIVDCRLGD
jgi:hypothetical protein